MIIGSLRADVWKETFMLETSDPALALPSVTGSCWWNLQKTHPFGQTHIGWCIIYGGVRRLVSRIWENQTRNFEAGNFLHANEYLLSLGRSLRTLAPLATLIMQSIFPVLTLIGSWDFVLWEAKNRLFHGHLRKFEGLHAIIGRDVCP